ncbi:MAG TPA: hypothetical protein VGK78_04710 [Nocardioides sp.]|uniref:hypothetical protein n=1 Tax=Nocardioides sp. TaxID=35761 RepID=UPI002F42CFBC
MPALLMLDKGFAVQDEGTYVTSYRFWSSNPYFAPGSQYVYGPIFEALDESIPLLRLLRLLMVVGVNAWFARCFVAWLERERSGLLPASRTALLLLITAAGGMSYLWAPLTPGYYDLTADCCLALTALFLMTLARAPRQPAWIPVLSGFVGVTLIVTKLTAFPALVLMVGAALWCVFRTSRNEGIRYLAYLVVGVVVAVLSMQLFLIPVGRWVSITTKVSAYTASGDHSFLYLAGQNLASAASLGLAAAVIGLPLLVGFLGARAAARRGGGTTARWCLLGGAGVTVVLPFLLGWHGGSVSGRAVVGVALAGLVMAALAALVRPPGATAGGLAARLLATVLLLVPLLQAAGTNVPVLYVAGECLAMWVALVLSLVTRSGVTPVARTAVLVDLMVLVVATAMISGTTTLMSPFKTTSLPHDTVGVSELGVRVAPTTAGEYRALVTALTPYVVRGSTPMITLDQLTGFTYLLGGVPAGSTWTDAASATRTADILELACTNGDVSRARQPVLILDRAMDPSVIHAMNTCGFDFPQGYRRLHVPSGPPDIRVYVPRAAS